MKKLLTILTIACSVNSWAQTNIKKGDIFISSTSTVTTSDGKCTVVDRKDNVIKKYAKQNYDKISAQQLIDYQTTCYNDSTYTEYWVTPNCNGEDKNGATTLMYCPPYLKKEWKHKTPTFEGFIKYIEKQYKLK